MTDISTLIVYLDALASSGWETRRTRRVLSGAEYVAAEGDKPGSAIWSDTAEDAFSELIMQAVSRLTLDAESVLRKLRCPSCGHTGCIFVGNGGYLTCGIAECPNPDFAESVDFETTAKREAEADRDRWRWASEYTWIWMVEHHATPSMSRAAWFRYVEERRQMHTSDGANDAITEGPPCSE